jgi:hypothetical protein
MTASADVRLDFRRQRTARRLVALALALTTGGTAYVLASVSGPAPAPPLAAVPNTSGGVAPAGGPAVVSPAPYNR